MSPAFWDRLWRSAGIQFVLLFVIAYFIYGDQPKLVLFGGTTWATSGLWAPDGVYSRFISPLIGLVRAAVISGMLLKGPVTARVPERTVLPQW